MATISHLTAPVEWSDKVLAQPNVVSFPTGEVVDEFECRVRNLMEEVFGLDFLCQMHQEKWLSEMNILDIATCPEWQLDGRIEKAFANRVFEKLKNKTL